MLSTAGQTDPDSSSVKDDVSWANPPPGVHRCSERLNYRVAEWESCLSLRDITAGLSLKDLAH